jgi:hypothetical protein
MTVTHNVFNKNVSYLSTYLPTYLSVYALSIYLCVYLSIWLPVFERAKTVHALDRAATVFGTMSYIPQGNIKLN